METKEIKIQTSFRLSENLIDRLKIKAKKANRSLNNYVECVLMNDAYNEPNETTIQAIEEARAGIFEGIIDTSNRESFMKSLE